MLATRQLGVAGSLSAGSSCVDVCQQQSQGHPPTAAVTGRTEKTGSRAGVVPTFTYVIIHNLYNHITSGDREAGWAFQSRLDGDRCVRNREHGSNSDSRMVRAPLRPTGAERCTSTKLKKAHPSINYRQPNRFQASLFSNSS